MIQHIKLSELCSMKSGGTPSRSKLEYYEGDFPWAKISDLEKSDDGYIYKTEEHITQEALESINNRQFKPGTLLLAMYGSVGKTAITKINLTTNQAILGINILDENIVDIKYLKYWFSTIKERLLNRAVGAALPNISLGIVKDLQIPLPPIETQQKIASILDAADTLRQKDKALLAKYDELTQALFLDMFGDPVSNTKGWEFKKLNELVSKLGDGLHGTPIYSEVGEYYFVNGNNLDNGKITISENTKRVGFSEFEKHKKDLNENTMLVSINGTIGKIAFYNNEKIILGKSACYFNLIKGSIRELFLFHIFKSDYFLRYSSSLSTGSTIQNVSLKTMREFPIPNPPITLQNLFAERVTLIEKQKAIAQASLEKSEELFNSLLQKAFKGELV
jgi:type I restriction enzyme S subunit